MNRFTLRKTTKGGFMSLSTIEADAEAIATKIEDFFEHLIPFHHPDNHAKIEAAKAAAVAAVTPPAATPETSSLESTATPTPSTAA
jgi:hypothetical protein